MSLTFSHLRVTWQCLPYIFVIISCMHMTNVMFIDMFILKLNQFQSANYTFHMEAVDFTAI